VPLNFNTHGYEDLFNQPLINVINLFCGAGFSVEASDSQGKKLPVGIDLLKELQVVFPTIKTYKNLPRACTRLIQTDKGSFYRFLETRFTVDEFSELYKALLDINIRNIYTTNIDDWFLSYMTNQTAYLF